MPVVEAHDLRMRFGVGEAAVDALCGIDLVIERGEFVAIMGPSGSGKSTLLNILGAIESPSGGRVKIDDTDLTKMDDNARTTMRRTRIGFIFQSFNLLPTLTAEENVWLPLALNGMPRAEAGPIVTAMLTQVKMVHRRTHTPSQLSGGEQQRLAIARALVIKPSLVLADEPTGNLDTATGDRIVDLLKGFVREKSHTLVVVTHDPFVASQADRVVHLRDGLLDSTAVLELPTR